MAARPIGPGGPVASGALARYATLLSRRGFRYYFTSLALGDAGYALYAIAILWLAIEVSGGSPVVVGLVLAVEFGIYAMSFLAGPVVDRVKDLRSILLVGFPAQGAIAALLGVVALTGHLTVPLLLALIVALSVLWDFTWTALNAALPRLVPPEELFLANGLTGAVTGGNQIAGYAIGAALLLVVASPGAAMLLYGALNIAAAVASLPVRAPRPESAVRSLSREFREGLRYLTRTRDPPVLSLTSFSAAQAFFSASGPVFLTVLAYRSFSDPTTAYGLMFSAFAVGGVVGSLVLGQLSPRGRVGAVLILAAVLEGLLIAVAVGVAPALGPSLAAWAAVGFADVAFYATVVTFFQATTPGPLLGRTLSNAYLFRGGSRAIGALALGFLAVAIAPFPLALLVAAAFVGVGLAGPALVPAIRSLRF